MEDCITLYRQILDIKKLANQTYFGAASLYIILADIKYGGDGEIRTLERLPFTHFPGVLLQPLGHVTLFAYLAKRSAS